MTVSFGYYNSVAGDRVYDAEDMSSFLEGIISDGILKDIGGELEVTAGSGMNAIVAAGKAWFLNTWTLNDGDITVTLDASHPTLPRIDRVILEVDKTSGVRANSIKKLTGTAASSPTAPTLVNTSNKRQYSLATIAVAAGASSLGAITNTRDGVDCGYARAMLAGSAEIQAQIDDLVAEDIVLDAYILPQFTNKSAGTLNQGALVIFDKSNDQAFTTTTLIGDRRVMGVVEDASIAANASGSIAMSGIHKVLVQGNVAVGQALIASTTAGRAMANGGANQAGIVGYAVTAYSGGGAGDVMAIIRPDFSRAGASASVIGTATGGVSASTSFNMTLAMGASANEKLVLIFVTSTASALTGVTVGGNAATQVLAIGGDQWSVWRYQGTLTGNQTVTCSGLNGSAQNMGLCICIEGHNPASPIGTAVRAAGTGTGPSASCSDANVGDFVVAALFAKSGAGGDLNAWGANQIEQKSYAVGGTSSTYGALSSEDAQGAAESSSATLGTSRTWGFAVVPVHLL